MLPAKELLSASVASHTAAFGNSIEQISAFILKMPGDNIYIIEFRNEFASHFKNLNIEWLQKYFYVEPKDEEMFSNPGKYIIDKGGYIFFVEFNGEIAGTFALMKVEEGVFELGKMAVTERHQGLKIGNKMLKFAIEKIKSLGAYKLILYSNTKLEPAIHLYRKYGFVEVPLENSEYKRSNIKMELLLDDKFVNGQIYEQDQAII